MNSVLLTRRGVYIQVPLLSDEVRDVTLQLMGTGMLRGGDKWWLHFSCGFYII